MNARKNIAVSHPVDRFHHLKQLISFPAISEVIFLFKVCALKDSHPSRSDQSQSQVSRRRTGSLSAAGKSAGN